MKSLVTDREPSLTSPMNKGSRARTMVTGLTIHGVNRKTLAEEVTLNTYSDGFKFNILGLLNT